MSIGGGGSSQQPVTTNTSSNPWGPSQGYLQNIMGQASNLYSSDTGYQPYPDWQSLQAPIPGQTQIALNSMQNLAQSQLGGSPQLQNARASIGSLLGGVDPLTGQRGGEGLTPSQIWTVTQMQNMPGQFQNLAGLGQQNYTALGNYAAGQAGAQNPYLQDIINANNRQISDRVNAAVSGAGRYGSGAQTNVLTRALAESANPILAQDYEARMGRQLQALGQQQGALGQIGAATQGQQGAWGNIADVYGQGANRMLQASQMIPGLDQAQYAPAQALAGVGDYYSSRSQNDINNFMNWYNASQARPWENLARYNAIIGGAGGLGGTKTQAVQNSISPGQRALGGAVAGAGLGSAFGPIGTGLGALGGGALGYFG